jgi:putative flippase GtrA
MAKFGFAGLAATATHVLILLVLVEHAGVGPVPASVPAFLAALLVSFLINHRWTFVARGAWGRYFSRYAAVSVAGLLLNLAIMYGTVSLMRQPYVVGLAMVVVLVPLFSFFLQRQWTFSIPTEASRE